MYEINIFLLFQVRTAIILISIFCALFNIPRFFEFQPVEAFDIRCNYTVIQIGKSPFCKNHLAGAAPEMSQNQKHSD